MIEPTPKAYGILGMRIWPENPNRTELDPNKQFDSVFGYLYKAYSVFGLFGPGYPNKGLFGPKGPNRI